MPSTIPSFLLRALYAREEGSPPVGEEELSRPYHYITRRHQLTPFLHELERCTTVAVDLETYPPEVALDPHQGKIRLLSLAWWRAKDVPCVLLVDIPAVGIAPLQPLLESPGICKVAHNARFEHRYLLAAGVEAGPWWDTMLADQVADGGLNRTTRKYFTLETVAERVLGQVIVKDEQTSDWGRPFLTASQLEYAAMDARVLLDLIHVQKPRLEEQELLEVAELEMAVLPAISWMNHLGVPFDVARWQDLATSANTRKATLKEALEAGFPPVTTQLRSGKFKTAPLNPNSPKQVKDALATLGIELQSVKEEGLQKRRDDSPLIPLLMEYRESYKQASTYGLGFLKHHHPLTQRIHPNYRQIGTVTGRMSCATPNMQNLPRDPAYRSCIRPVDGRVLVKADLSRIELCVAAELAGDTKLMDALRAQEDPYRITASALYSVPVEDVTAAQRQMGKTITLGTLYGMGAWRLREQYPTLSEEEAQELLNRFYSAWPRLAGYRRQRLWSQGTYVRTASGRIRYLKPEDRATVRLNTPVQGLAADGFKAALALLWEERRQYPGVIPILAVHDEIVLESLAEQAQDAATWLTSCLQRGMRRYMHKAPVDVSITIARDWSGAQA